MYEIIQNNRTENEKRCHLHNLSNKNHITENDNIKFNNY